MTNLHPHSPPTARDAAATPANRRFVPIAGAALGLGIAGLFIPVIAFAAIVVGTIAIRRVRAAGDDALGLPHSIIAVCLGGLGLLTTSVIILMAWSMMTVGQRIPAISAFSQAMPAYHGANRFAGLGNGQYPTHIVETLLDQGVATPVHLSVTSRGGVPGPGQVTIGAFDFADYDDTEGDRQLIQAELQRLDLSSPTYRFGNCTFVRLAEPTGSGDLIFLWMLLPDLRTVGVITDDGMPAFIDDRSDWAAIWERDAAARIRLELPPLPLPPYPDE